MRYYSLTLQDPTTGASIVPAGEGFTRGTGPTFSSLYSDPFTGRIQPDPGALNIEFDIPVIQLAQPQGSFRVKVQGVGLRMIGQAASLAGLRFQLKAGMSAGLPLANPVQAGIIAEGNVFEAWGNWIGVDQTLDMLINPGPPGTTDSVFNLPVPFFWPAGSSLDEAIATALAAALPGFKHQIFIDSNLTLANDEAGYYQNFSQFASYLQGITLKIGSQYIKNYPGVSVAVNGDVISVFDGTQGGGPAAVLKQLNFEDLIGQPTWISGTQVGFQTVLRADLGIANRVRFPQGIVTPYAITSPQAGAAATSPSFPLPAKNRSVFQGDFVIQEVHHFGNLRQPTADAWTTAFVATPPAGAS